MNTCTNCKHFIEGWDIPATHEEPGEEVPDVCEFEFELTPWSDELPCEAVKHGLWEPIGDDYSMPFYVPAPEKTND